MEPLRHDMTGGLETGSGSLPAAHGPDSSSCGNFQPKWPCPTGRRSEELKIPPTRFLNPSTRPEERDGGSEEQAAEERSGVCAAWLDRGCGKERDGDLLKPGLREAS